VIARTFGRLRGDVRGVTVLEFAFVIPPMLFLLMGGGEIVYQAYVQSILDGAIQKAGRDSAIQGGGDRADELDGKVLTMVRVVAKTAVIADSKRSYYASFSRMKPETFYDTNSNNRYDAATECFDDVNGNKTWDADPGTTGQGGANDVTLYQLKVKYDRLFPVTALLGWDGTKILTARTLLKNQPYASQKQTPVVNTCPKP